MTSKRRKMKTTMTTRKRRKTLTGMTRKTRMMKKKATRNKTFMINLENKKFSRFSEKQSFSANFKNNSIFFIL